MAFDILDELLESNRESSDPPFDLQEIPVGDAEREQARSEYVENQSRSRAKRLKELGIISPETRIKKPADRKAILEQLLPPADLSAIQSADLPASQPDALPASQPADLSASQPAESVLDEVLRANRTQKTETPRFDELSKNGNWQIVLDEHWDMLPDGEKAEVNPGRALYDQNVDIGYRMKVASDRASNARLERELGIRQGAEGYRAARYWAERGPWAGSILNVYDLVEYRSTIRRIKNDPDKVKGTDLLRIMSTIEEAKRSKDKSWGRKVFDLASTLPGTMAEIAATGGLFSAGKFVAKGVSKVVAGRAATKLGRDIAITTGKIAAPIVGAAIQTTGQLDNVAEGIARQMIPDFKLHGDEANVLRMKILDSKDKPLDWLEGSVKGWGDAFVETFTDRVLGGAAQSVLTKIAPGMQRIWPSGR